MKIPALWHVALRAVQETCPGAIIAGGALRDLDNDRPVKDVDIFFPCDGADAFAAAVWTLETELDVKTDYTLGKEYRENFNDVVGVARFTVQNTEFDLIGIDLGVSRVKRIIDRFDFGLCQISYDGKLVFRTAAYWVDMRVQQFTFLKPSRCDFVPIKASLKRWNRLQAKYAGWPLVLSHTWDEDDEGLDLLFSDV